MSPEEAIRRMSSDPFAYRLVSHRVHGWMLAVEARGVLRSEKREAGIDVQGLPCRIDFPFDHAYALGETRLVVVSHHHTCSDGQYRSSSVLPLLGRHTWCRREVDVCLRDLLTVACVACPTPHAGVGKLATAVGR